MKLAHARDIRTGGHGWLTNPFFFLLKDPAGAVTLEGPFKALAVLCHFVQHPGQLVTKDDLFAAAWPETVVSDATLASCIQEIRQALGDDAKRPRYIETVHRRGFRFIEKVVSSQ